MESTLSTLAFALLIGAQFLGAIVPISKRQAIYGEAESPESAEASSGRSQTVAAERELPVEAA
jgi:hypothetical protein